MKCKAIAMTVLAILLVLSAPLRAEDNSWTDRVDFSGDFRLRFEAIDEEFEAERDRFRFRGRFGFKVDVADNLNFVLRLATGGDNPVSTNQTFDDGFSTKDIGIDLAYVDWKITDELNFYGGKIKNPLFRAGSSQLVWDGDLNPEGFAVKYSTANFFGTVGGFSVEERGAADDSFLYIVQGGLSFPFGESNKLTVGVSYFAYTNTVGNSAFYNGKAKGNTLDDDDLYVYDYKGAELSGQFDTNVMGWPLQLHAVYVKNSEVGRQDTAYGYGARLGSSKDKGQMQFSWSYRDIEADAVIGTFGDSDFGGGGTDAKGHFLKAKYGLSEKVFIGGTLFVNEVERFQSIEHDYNRLQLDLEIKFD